MKKKKISKKELKERIQHLKDLQREEEIFNPYRNNHIREYRRLLKK